MTIDFCELFNCVYLFSYDLAGMEKNNVTSNFFLLRELAKVYRKALRAF